MRDSAVLTRPVVRESTWQEPAARRTPFRPTQILLGGLFLAALAIGFAMTRIVPGAPVQRVSDTEYTAVVAQLFLKDHNLSLARDRLISVGEPSDLVRRAIALGQAGQLASANDRAALDSLSAALLAPSATAGPDQPSATAATPVSTTPTSNEGDSPISWIGPLVAFFVALGLGFLVLARTAGLSLGALSLPWRNRPTPGHPVAPRRNGVIANRRNESGRPSSVSIAEVDLDADDDSELKPQPIVSRSTAVRRSRSAVATANRPTVFQSQYRLGDDPFEEIHPIADPRTGGLVAACGLTATLHLDSARTGGYYAFTAWIQDYAGGDELHAAGLVAPGATEVARSAIDSWVRSGQVDTVLSLEPGASAVIGTEDIKATVSVVGVTYGDDARVADAFVTNLNVRFEIQTTDDSNV